MDPILNPFDYVNVPFGDWAEASLDYIVDRWRGTLIASKAPVQAFLVFIQQSLLKIPPLILLLVVGALGYLIAGWRLALVGLVCLTGIGLIGAWAAAMTTLSIVLTAVCICVLIGLPIGIMAARSDRFFKVLRPILDLMQAIPSFVYLVPVVMLFGIGDTPGVIVTCLFAISPLIRLTNLGIREVREDLAEAARAFGASDLKVLLTIQLPLARPTLLAGLNQSVPLVFVHGRCRINDIGSRLGPNGTGGNRPIGFWFRIRWWARYRYDSHPGRSLHASAWCRG